jgi:hypothetical protein
MRRVATLVVLTATFLGTMPAAGWADNCSGLQDCYGTIRSAAAASSGMALLIGISVLLLPGLLRGVGTRTRPGPGTADEDGAPQAAEVPEPEGTPLRMDEKVRADMACRGWTAGDVERTVRQPQWANAARDRRYNLDGSRDDAPAAMFIAGDGRYVIVNRLTNDVVQISGSWLTGVAIGRADPEALPSRIAADVAVPGVVSHGPEHYYPVTWAYRVIDYCEINRIVILGMDGFHSPAWGMVRALPDLILDCSVERGQGHSGTRTTTAERARRLLRSWSAEPNIMVSITVRPGTMSSASRPTNGQTA